MAVNQSHTQNRRGAIIPYGESVLKQCQDVALSFPQQPQGSSLFSGTKKGTLFLTSYRVIFVTLHSVRDPMLSFMMPFDLIRDCTVEQPFFAPNYIKGTVTAAPDGGWEGQAVFKLSFRRGGAIEFSQLMTQAAVAAARGIPFGNINYWYGRPAVYVVVPGRMSMMCTRENPCSAIIYTSAPLRALPVDHETQSLGYRAPPVRDAAPPPGYGALPPEYEALPAEYGATPPGYGAPPAENVAPPPGYGAPPPEYGALPAEYGATPPGYGVLSAGYGTQPQGQVVGQPPGQVASFPSASSPQAHSSPSRM